MKSEYKHRQVNIISQTAVRIRHVHIIAFCSQCAECDKCNIKVSQDRKLLLHRMNCIYICCMKTESALYMYKCCRKFSALNHEELALAKYLISKYAYEQVLYDHLLQCLIQTLWSASPLLCIFQTKPTDRIISHALALTLLQGIGWDIWVALSGH